MYSIDANSLKWAYQKLKSYIYYSLPASYLKDKMIEFEKNYNANSFVEMANDLNYLFSTTHDMLRGQGISYTIFPKKDGVSSINNNIIVAGFNVFVDMPLKFYLVDVLFTLDIFESLQYDMSDYSFGNDFDKRLWQIKKNELDGSILENKLLFANFNAQYDLWKEKIYAKLEETADEDKTIIKMDFQRSYYNVYFDINKFIIEYLGGLNNPIYQFEKQLYCYYSTILDDIIQWSPHKTSFVHLPIGLMSSACIYNILLKSFDEAIASRAIAYSRYVDDILIVLPKMNRTSLNEILEEQFPGIFESTDNGDIKVKAILDANGKYIINAKKIKVLTYKSGYPLESIRAKLNKVIKPSMDVIEEMDFEDDNGDEFSLFRHDYLKKIIQQIKDVTDERCDFIKNLSDSEYINLYSSWKMLLAKVNNDDYFLGRIKDAINRTSLSIEKDLANKKLRFALSAELDYACNSNRYKQHLLCDIEQERAFEHIKEVEVGNDDFFYPLTSTFDEITLYLSQMQEGLQDGFIAHAEALYRKANNLSKSLKCNISMLENDGRFIYTLSPNNIAQCENRKIRLAVANMNLTEEEAIEADSSGEFPSTYNIREFTHLIDLAKNFGAEIIVFPEFALPERYALDITKHCRKRKISIITGLTHRKHNGDLVNQILIRDKDIDLALFKWKNYMPVDEKKICLERGNGYYVPQTPYYLVVDNGKCKYSSMTCFEATCIVDRAILCDRIELLLMPVFNRDTFYFSNIIASFVRDASCFVAQANSNFYGDSRISGPYSQVELDLVKLKGGLNNYFVVGELDLDLLSFNIRSGEILESNINASMLFLPKWDDDLESEYNEYKNNKTKPISAGCNRYNIRKHNGLDE